MEGTPALIPRHRARGPNLSAALRSALTHTHAVRRFPLASGWDAGPSQLQPHSSRSGRNRALPVLLKKNMKPTNASFHPRAQTQLQNPQPALVDCCSSDRRSRTRPASFERHIHGRCAQGMRPRACVCGAVFRLGPCQLRCISLPPPFCNSTTPSPRQFPIDSQGIDPGCGFLFFLFSFLQNVRGGRRADGRAAWGQRDQP